VRVRIAKDQARAEVSASGGLLVGPADTTFTTNARRLTSTVAVTHYQGAFLITDTNRQALRWALPALMLTPLSAGTPITYNGKSYPGSMALVPVLDAQGRATGKLDVVNHVGMESYLPGVVERELYGSWEPTTFRAAAIAARSYAVFESSLNTHRHYDLESSTASQAYSGQATNPKAAAAVAQTRGMLLEYQGRVVPAFYSSACGGAGQDAVAAFTWLPGLPDIDPLRGRNHGACCQASTKFRWGPVTRNKSTLEQRIRQWGVKEGHPIKALRGIRDIRVAGVNAVGRPTAFTVTDLAGVAYTLGPEQFRFACNTEAPGIGAVPKEQTLYSSHVQVSTNGSNVIFANGHGYGHGVGLCQFGAQGLAKTGYNEYSILAYYYPGSRVVRAYP
jgi:stage II sporulation protein D